ncbi:hypothetical protein PR048_026646 [Dryococelus australis]|uniref:Uncharacterized protein n=1 Tax=Dryococelus australis TaxID=614101 RepID=A0ABQ9GLY4_9NEOP|nr:hypothetical protein PR048_026646 [Dryococelus australis]
MTLSFKKTDKLDEKHVGFESYVSCDERVVTCGIQSVDVFCEANSVVRDSSDDEIENASAESAVKIPSFSEAHSALETLKHYCYAYNMSECEQEIMLQVEATMLHLRRTPVKN